MLVPPPAGVRRVFIRRSPGLHPGLRYAMPCGHFIILDSISRLSSSIPNIAIFRVLPDKEKVWIEMVNENFAIAKIGFPR